ncbi:MAG: class I SAM-dependent methyltransferase [Thermodesulfovibrio sp.]|uniref:class I SAM-dependent methyltransferase n=1 Tax=unclassified Thermodesulfovibrio TaxID=2645936 RepID=UPI00083A516D|nr:MULTISPECIES: class I SAM-dependent methyltransferase [unclassified Thermodesulfovibrio]MDI1471845.1 class I SAM-dependent methyltransferase [Thermodesulfovibrio sp. 1176]MDI6713735.1 class I SAM-dependent methyltransferase [Thermodesulfovibrio sp.]ODA44830.1 hypothetical protein THER_0458 [Thermodesulfovibrio sp. N1]
MKGKFGPFEGILEETTCPVCRETNEVSKVPEAKLIFRSHGGIGYYRCSQCNLMYASPRFTEESMLKIYEREEFADLSEFNNWSYEKWKESRNRSYNVQKLKIMLVERYLSQGDRILDVGCGTGLFILEANKKGFLCEGVEPSLMLSNICKNVLKVPVNHTLLENFVPPYKFNGIIIWDVLEHVYNPVRIIKKSFELSEWGGFLFLQVPNYRGISNQYKNLLCRLGIRDNEYRHFGFPWHVYSFDKRSLSFLLGKTGFKVILFESWSHWLKDGWRNPLLKKLSIYLRKWCLSDYIVCVAKKV